MDGEIDKIERKNRIESKIYLWGLVAFALVVFSLLAKMVISAL